MTSTMKDFYGITVKVGDDVLYGSGVKGSSHFKRGRIVEIIGDKAKIKGLVKKRNSDEIISEIYYLNFLDKHPEFFI